MAIAAPSEAVEMFSARYRRAKMDGIARPDALAIAKAVASDYLAVYEGTGWEWNDLFRAILSHSARKAAEARKRRKAARARRDRDLGGQYPLFPEGGM